MEEREYTVVFSEIERQKSEEGFEYTSQLITQSFEVSKEIEKLREITKSMNECSFSILTTA